MVARMMRLLNNLQYKAAINRHIHHDSYKVLAVLIPDSVQQLPALFKFRLQFMDLFAKQIHGITISFIQLYSMTCRLFCFIEKSPAQNPQSKVSTHSSHALRDKSF